MHTEFFNQERILERFVPARQLEGLKTSWISYPLMVREDAGFTRQQLQRFLEGRGIATRMVWSGNILRQPAFKNTIHKAAPGGYPNADRVMKQGTVPLSIGTGAAMAATTLTSSPIFQNRKPDRSLPN